MTAPSDSEISAVPAATVIVLRRAPAGGPPQVLLLKRAPTMRFAAGAVVFPGGRIDPADHALAAVMSGSLPSALDPTDLAARIAAIRETLEETGLAIGVNQAVTSDQAAQARAMLAAEGALAPVLARFRWTLALEHLVPYARWCPSFRPAFDTRFYLTDLGTGAVTIAEDGTENTALFWSSAAEALAEVESGALSALFPTLCNLQRLAQYGSIAEAQADIAAYPPRLLTPRIVAIDGIDHIEIPEHTGYPYFRHPVRSGIRRT